MKLWPDIRFFNKAGYISQPILLSPGYLYSKKLNTLTSIIDSLNFCQSNKGLTIVAAELIDLR